MDRSFLLLDPSLRVLSAGLSMLSNDGNTFDDSTLLVYEDFEDTPRLALVCTAKDDDLVALLDMLLTHFFFRL